MASVTTSATTPSGATPDDLMRVDGKAELIGGRIVHFMPTGYRPGRVALRIAMRLDAYAESAGRGVVLGDNVAYVVPELGSGRESFSPDASYHLGLLPANEMKFIKGPPTFAVEIRSKEDHGPAAERGMAAKRADYFEAGTLVVWDVDPIAATVAAYRSTTPDQPAVFGRGDTADAEPAAPGWRLAVDDLFA